LPRSEISTFEIYYRVFS